MIHVFIKDNEGLTLIGTLPPGQARIKPENALQHLRYKRFMDHRSGEIYYMNKNGIKVMPDEVVIK